MFDGQAEAAAITARLDAVGTVLEDVPDDYVPPGDWTGAPDAYMVLDFGSPVAAARGRGLGVSEQGQPYFLPFQVTYIGSSKSAVRTLRAAGDTALVGWEPVPGNDTEIKAAGGFIPPSLAVENKPTQNRQIRWYTVGTNGTVEELSA